MSQTRIGWFFVAVQGLLLITLVALPSGDTWSTPAWLNVIGLLAVVGGLALVAAAALGLGPALTPTPVPSSTDALTTDGFYRHVRHPIYSGVLVAVIGVTLRSGSLAVLAVAGATVAFFMVKARWEEGRLAERYQDYPAYASETPRFVPRLGRRNRG